MGIQRYDLAILGGGPGGYVAAIKAAQAGLKVACIEERPSLGGTCLNVGCIPTKALLNMTHKLEEASTTSRQFANIGSVSGDWTKMQRNKDQIVTSLTKGIEFLFKKNKVDLVKSRGHLKSPNSIATSSEPIEGQHILLAMGSIPSPMPGGFLTVDEKKVVTSTGALALTKVPSKLLIIGGGAIGLEFATMFTRLGSKVEVIEFMPQIAQGFDLDISQQLMKTLQRQGIKFHLKHKVTGADLSGPGVKLVAEAENNKNVEFNGDIVLVAVGRRANSSNIGLEEIGVKMDKVGRILVDDEFRTSVPSIRAIGDLIPGPMLAHKAEEDGCVAVASILGHKEDVDYSHCPAVIYTSPEVAMLGLSESELKKMDRKFKKGTFPLAANSRARANNDTDGMVKIMSCPNTGEILGASIVGPNAGDLIQILVLAKKFKISAKDLGDTIFPHPTVSESIKEAALAAAYGKAIHM